MVERLIPPIQEKIKRYLWGAAEDWKRKLDITKQPLVYDAQELANRTCCERCGRDLGWWECACTCVVSPNVRRPGYSWTRY